MLFYRLISNEQGSVVWIRGTMAVAEMDMIPKKQINIIMNKNCSVYRYKCLISC